MPEAETFNLLGDQKEEGDGSSAGGKEKKKQAEKKTKTPPISLSGGKKRKRASKCLTCGLTTEDYPLLLSHQMLEHGAKVVPVHYCGYSGCWFPFGTRLEKTDHEKNRHGSVIDVFVCIICKFGETPFKYLKLIEV